MKEHDVLMFNFLFWENYTKLIIIKQKRKIYVTD